MLLSHMKHMKHIFCPTEQMRMLTQQENSVMVSAGQMEVL